MAPKTNTLGIEKAEYTGGKSTLCGGCGHDSVTRALTGAYWEAGVQPWNVAKMSGIGCSAKTITYFLGKSHGFNGVHGRMPAMATGVHLANRSLQVVGVSGDGDTASIGIGQFLHAARRNTDMLYVLENNGVYGLTKGQFSATARQGTKAKNAGQNPYPEIDCAALAIELGCGFVARTFSAHQNQMNAIFQAAIAYRGFALIDVISPCVTFNPDIDGSSKSYQWAKEHEINLNDIGVIPDAGELEQLDMGPGEVRDVELEDGTMLRLRTVEEGYDPSDKIGALARIHQAIERSEMLTGLLYLDENRTPVADLLDLVEEPLYDLDESRTRPPEAALHEIMEELG